MCYIDIINNITSIVIDVRKELSLQYDIESDHYKGYLGLCNEAYVLFKHKVETFNTQNSTKYKILYYHGEQKHSPKIDRINWKYQHTWMGIFDPTTNKILYVDPTSQQFRFLYNDIPDFYISFIPPKWYIDDKKNLFFFIYRINKWVAINIIEKIDYYIWGGLCNNLQKIIFKK